MFYYLFNTDGTKKIIETTERLEYEALKEIVDGYIEYGQVGIWTAMVNEDGLGSLKINPFFPCYAGTVLIGMDVNTDDGLFFEGFKSPEKLLENWKQGSLSPLQFTKITGDDPMDVFPNSYYLYFKN
jgi:hypothetical protein